MQSDPWWSFAMAINVFMVFFFSANPKSFLRYWWAYCIVCYGLPTIPAIWLFFIRSDDGQGSYGDATVSQYPPGGPRRHFSLSLASDLVLDR